jgi:glyoxylase I family protein
MRGHHVAVRTPSLAEAKDFYVGKLDFRVVAEWYYADEKLAYLAPPTDDHFYVEVLGGGNTLPPVAKLRARGVAIIAEPFTLPAISRKLAFFADPFGNLIELAEVLP